MYLLARRAFSLSEFTVFDQPVVATNCPERTRAAVPLQSLTMLNGALLWDEAQRMAERLGPVSRDAPNQRIARAFELAFAREPTSEEAGQSALFLERQAALYQQQGQSADAAAMKAWTHLCHTLLNASEFLYSP
jgi:hypothetical protein